MNCKTELMAWQGMLGLKSELSVSLKQILFHLQVTRGTNTVYLTVNINLQILHRFFPQQYPEHDKNSHYFH